MIVYHSAARRRGIDIPLNVLLWKSRLSLHCFLVLLFNCWCFCVVVKPVSAQDDQFQIQAVIQNFPNYDGGEICLQVRNPFESGAKIVTKSCDASVSNQKFTVDEYGRFHTVNDESLCMTKVGGSNIEISDCGSVGSDPNMFVYNAFDNTINWRRNGRKVISVKGDQPKLNKPVKLRKRVHKTSKMQRYLIKPSSLYLDLDDIPAFFHIRLVSDETMCLEAASSDPGSAITVNTCEAGNPNQMWNFFHPFFAVIGLGIFSPADEKCIVKQGNTLFLGSCQNTDSNMFMYNGVDKALHLRKNGKKVITFNNQGNVVLSNKQPSNSNQMWTLDDIMTINDNVITIVGSNADCTDDFPNGACGLCMGDCDNDSDCFGDYRCAARVRTDGQENVPGCTWGPDSEDLKLDNRDYCFQPTSEPGVINYVGECGEYDYLCGMCEGNCHSNSDCEDGLFCVQREGFEEIEGCTGAGGDRDMYGKNICSGGPQRNNIFG